MLSLALTLLLFAAQPDDGPVSTQQVVPPPSAAGLEAAKRRQEAEKQKREEDRRKLQESWKTMWDPQPAPPAAPAPGSDGKLGFDDALAASYAGKPAPAPQTEEERRAAANAAAIARAEQAGADVNAPPGKWPDEGKMRCKSTDSGFVCGNSDKALEPDSPSRRALDDLLNKPN